MVSPFIKKLYHCIFWFSKGQNKKECTVLRLNFILGQKVGRGGFFFVILFNLPASLAAVLLPEFGLKDLNLFVQIAQRGG